MGVLTFRAESWIFGFLLPILFLSERMASFGWTVLERMVSEISRLRAMSSLPGLLVFRLGEAGIWRQNVQTRGRCPLDLLIEL